MKHYGLYLLFPVLLLMLSGCQQATSENAPAALVASVGNEVFASEIPYDTEINEKVFIAQTNDIYINADEYMGKAIKLEGMFFSSYYEPSDSLLCTVIRYGPGCCGDDGNVGFEVTWADESIPLPEDNAWVEAIGVLERYEEFGSTYLRLNLTHLAVLEERGQETVVQ